MQQQLLDEFDLCGCLLRVSVLCVCCSINVWVQGVAGPSKQLGGAGAFLVRYGGFFGKKWEVWGGSFGKTKKVAGPYSKKWGGKVWGGGGGG